MKGSNIRLMISNHWFLLAAPLVLLTNLFVTQHEVITPLVEFGVLFDLVILVPVLYVLCYRARKRGIGAKALALACLGVWVATQLVPEQSRNLLVYLQPLRYVGLAVLVIMELALIRMIFTSLMSGASSDSVERQVVDESDVPEWVAKLMVWEAGLWRRLFSMFRRRSPNDADDTR